MDQSLKEITSLGEFPICARQETETLDAQIERLNCAVELLMKQSEDQERMSELRTRFYTGNSSYPVSRSSIWPPQVSDIGFSGEIESEARSNYDDEYLGKLENLLERVSMEKEDLQSHEYRRSFNSDQEDYRVMEKLAKIIYDEIGVSFPEWTTQGFAKSVKKLTEKDIEVTLFQLYQLHNELSKMISLAEDKKCSDGTLALSPYVFSVHIKDTRSHLFPKPNILSQFTSSGSVEDHSSYISLLERRIQTLQDSSTFPRGVLEYNKKLQISMRGEFEKIYQNSLYDIELLYKHQKVDDLREKNPVKMQLEVRQLLRTKLDHDKLKREIEWEYSELSIIRNDFQAKERDLLQKKQFLDKQRELIKQRVIQLEKDREKFEETIENYEIEKNEEKEQLEILRDTISQVKREFLDISITPTNKTTEDSLRAQISILEASLKTLNASQKEAIQTRLMRCKTHLSNLRSKKAISMSLNNSNSLRSVMTKVERNWEHQEQKRSESIGRRINKSYSTRLSKSPSLIRPQPAEFSTPHPPLSRPPIPLVPMPKQKREPSLNPEATKELRRAKAALQEKEEQLSAELKRVQDTWMSVPEAGQLISLVNSEQERLWQQKQQMENWSEGLAHDRLELSRKSRTLSEKEQELLLKSADLLEEETYLYDKKLLIDNKLSSLIECLFNSVNF